MFPTETDVLIVGAGPTGLALAITLQQAGIRHVLIDALPQGQNTSRAAVIHAHTLDALVPLGVADQLAGHGLKLPTFSVRDRDRRLLSLGFGVLPSEHAYLLMLPQHETEKILVERLIALGGTIHRGVTTKSAKQTQDEVLVGLATSAGEMSLCARYVVGADGMHSKIREAAGIAYEGSAYAYSFVLADIHMDWPLQNREVSLFFSEAGLVVVAPLPDGAFRIVATLDPAPDHPDVSDIQALLDSRGPVAERAIVRDVIWSSRFRIHHRLASAYRNGRLMLVGDAAHVHSPAGGQGMNCGLVDATMLGRLLSDVVRGRRPEAALDLYNELRRPAAADVLALAGRLTGFATMTGRFRRALRNATFRIIDHIGPAKRALAMNLSGLAREHLAKLPAAESRGPVGTLRSGTQARLHA